MNVMEIANQEIIKRLEDAEKNGTKFFWVSPFSEGKPVSPLNYVSEQYYHGINSVLLQPNEYLTYPMIQSLNKKSDEMWHIRKGAKGKIVLYYNTQPVKDKKTGEIVINEKTGEPETQGFWKYYHVFSREDVVNKEGENLPSKLPIKRYNHDDIIEDMRNKLNQFNLIFNAYTKKYGINVERITDGTQAYYCPATNTLRIPLLNNFSSVYEYIHVCSHEMIHSTMKALGRDIYDTEKQRENAMVSYSREELVAEVGSDLLCARLGIWDDCDKENSLAYLQGWSKYLKDKKTELVNACSKSEKAVNLILELDRELVKDNVKEER